MKVSSATSRTFHEYAKLIWLLHVLNIYCRLQFNDENTNIVITVNVISRLLWSNFIVPIYNRLQWNFRILLSFDDHNTMSHSDAASTLDKKNKFEKYCCQYFNHKQDILDFVNKLLKTYFILQFIHYIFFAIFVAWWKTLNCYNNNVLLKTFEGLSR